MVFVALGALHLLALGLGIAVLLLALREDAGLLPAGEEDSDGGGGPPKAPAPPQRRPPGGLPLARTTQSDVRLRGPGRLADLLPDSPRRGPSEPAHPATRPAPRTPARR